MRKIGIYVHIPFCERKCDYCNFVSFKCDDETKERYINNLICEMELEKNKYLDCEVDTVFIGGGTPSCLREKSIKTLLNYIENNFNVNTNAEITVEANPNSLTIDKLREFKLAGVNRLSIGLQTYNDNLLKLIGRLHTKKQFDIAVRNAKKIGFTNINVDLLLGLPKQKLGDIKSELKHLVRLKIPHISAYGLIVEKDTKLYKNLQDNIYALPSDELSVKMYEYTLKYLKKHKIMRYEVSNFAQKGYESKHNLKYWNMQEYIGFGLASHSFFDNTRWENTSNLSEYFEKIERRESPAKNKEKLTITDLKEEYIMTELRKASGFCISDYDSKFGENILFEKNDEIENMIKLGLIQIKDDRLFATNKGFEFLNQIILNLV